MKIVKSIRNHKTLFVKYFKYKGSNFSPISIKNYDVEIPKVTVSNFITNLENGVYEIPRGVNTVILYKEEGILLVPLTGFVKFKKIKDKYKII